MSKLKETRIKRGIKQCAVADELGVARQTYREYEKNPQQLSIAQAQTICNFLHCRLSDIVTITTKGANMLKLNLKARNFDGTNWSPDFAHDVLDTDTIWDAEYKDFDEIKKDRCWQSFANVKKDDNQEAVLEKIANAYMYHSFDDTDDLWGKKLADAVEVELIDAETDEVIDCCYVDSFSENE